MSSTKSKLRVHKPRSGRPRDLGKRSDILQAAFELFCQTGLASMTIDAVAARAGVAKQTVYQNFKNREELFREVIFSQTPRFEAPSNTMCFKTNPRKYLIDRGVRLLRFLESPELIACGRTMPSQSREFPELTRMLIEHGPRKEMRHYAEVLQEMQQKGDFKFEDTMVSADQLTSMFKGAHLDEMIHGVVDARTDAERLRHVTACVDLLLRAARSQ